MWEWICLIIYLLCEFFLLRAFKEDTKDIPSIIVLYLNSIFSLVSYISLFTWIHANQSVFMFYLCLIIVIFIYISQTFKTTKIFKYFFDQTGKKRYIIILEITIMVLSLLFCFYIVVIYGMFIYDNIIASQHELYNMPQTDKTFDIQWFFKFCVWNLNTIKELFLIGIKFLFTTSLGEDWEWFFSFNKWIYTSVIFINVINTIHNTGKIVNFNHEE